MVELIKLAKKYNCEIEIRYVTNYYEIKFKKLGKYERCLRYEISQDLYNACCLMHRCELAILFEMETKLQKELQQKERDEK